MSVKLLPDFPFECLLVLQFLTIGTNTFVASCYQNLSQMINKRRAIRIASTCLTNATTNATSELSDATSQLNVSWSMWTQATEHICLLTCLPTYLVAFTCVLLFCSRVWLCTCLFQVMCLSVCSWTLPICCLLIHKQRRWLLCFILCLSKSIKMHILLLRNCCTTQWCMHFIWIP